MSDRAPSAVGAGSAKPSILVVDDEVDMRDMIAYGLAQEGFETATASGGEEALALLQTRRFDVALTDLKMPGMDGVATVAALKDADPDLEVIVITGFATVETAIAALQHGAYDYIQKPFDLPELKLVVDRAMEKHRLRAAVALYEASRALLSTLDRGDLVALALEQAAQMLGAYATGLLLTAGDSLDAHIWGLPAPDAERLFRELGSAAIEQGEPLRTTTEDVPGWDLVSQGQAPASVLACPLPAPTQVIGALVLLREAVARPFSRAELRDGMIFSAQVALALDNSRAVAELKRAKDELAVANEKLSELAITDPLTSLHNRRHLERELEREFDRAIRYRRPLSVLLVDADHFKDVNDRHGHAAGDRLLIALADALRASVRRTDIAGRLGGDEFMVVCPETGAELARGVAARLRDNARRVLVEAGSGVPSVTISIGIATADALDGVTRPSFVELADRALYQAKAAGRDRVELLQP